MPYPDFSQPATPEYQAPEPARVVVPSARPSVTYTIIALNVLVFVAMLLSGVSIMGPTPEVALAWGADFGPLTLPGQPWRLLTCCFVHFGIIHIGMNMYVLYQIGPFTERLFGHMRYLLLYLLAGLGGSVVSLYVHPNAVGAGASGAIFGVYGGLLAYMFSHRSVIPKQSLRAIGQSAAIFLGYNFLFGLQGSIDLSAHIGGLVFGFLVGLALSVGRGPSALARNAIQ